MFVRVADAPVDANVEITRSIIAGTMFNLIKGASYGIGIVLNSLSGIV